MDDHSGLQPMIQEVSASLASTMKVHDAILDGELVCLDQDGRPMFDALMYRRAEPLLRRVRSPVAEPERLPE